MKHRRKKQLTILGVFWDFHSLFRTMDRLYESKFISFYNPWLKGFIDKERIINFQEKNKSFIFFPLKVVHRTISIFLNILNFSPDSVITHHDEAHISLLPSIFLIKKILRLKNRSRFIFWVRNNPIECYAGGLYGRIVLFCYINFYHWADTIVVQCKANAKIISENFPKLKSKIKIIPNMYDSQMNIELSSEELTEDERNIFSDSFIFLNIGRLTEQKGQWFLIRAFQKVAEKFEKARLVIIGEGELRSQLETLIKDLNLSKKVFLLGRKENPFKFIKRSQCFILPSLWEGLPNVIIEALMFNIPIISSDCLTGPREILAPKLEIKEKVKYPYYGEYGILFETFNRKFTLAALKELPLLKEELILKSLMERMIYDFDLKKRYAKGEERANEYDINSSQLIDLINDTI